MHPGIFQWVKRLRDGIVLVVTTHCDREGSGSLEQMVDVSLHGLVVAALRCTY